MTRDHLRRRVLGALAGGLSAGVAGCAGLDAALPNTGPDGFDLLTFGEGVEPVDPTGDATLTPSASAWPTFGGAGTNAGATGVTAVDDPLVHRWTAEFPGQLPAQTTEPFAAVVADGRVFTYRRELETDDGTERNVVVAFDADSGDLSWTAPIRPSGGSGGISDAYHAGTVVDGTLYVCSSSGSDEPDAVLAIAADAGEREWTNRIDGDVQGSPAVADGVVYAAGDPTVCALDAATGEGLWAVDSGSYSGSVATDGDRVIAAPGDRLAAFDARTGELAWERELPSVVNDRESPVVADGTVVYVHEHTGFAVDAADGEVLWRTESEAVDGPKPAVGNGLAVFVDNGDAGATVRAFGVDDGDTRWETALELGVLAPPVVGSDRVYVVAGESLYELDIDDGSVIDERWVRGRTNGEPAVTTAGVFVGHTRGVTALARGERPPLPDVGGWVTAGGDPANTRRNADATPPPSDLSVEWRAAVGDQRRLVVADGLVVVGTRGGIRGVEADSGTVRWRRRLADRRTFPTTSPVAVDGVICATASDGTAVAVRPEDGSVVWERGLDGEFVAPMTTADGLAYAFARDGGVYGLDPRDGTVETTADVGGGVNVGPAAGHGRIFVSNGGLSVIDTDGDLRWADTPARFPALSPSVFDRGVAVAVNDGTVRGYSPSGRRLWRADVYDVDDGVPMFPTAVHDGDVIAAGYGTETSPPALAAVDGETGDVRWRVETDELETGPVVADGLVWVATGGTLVGFVAETGDRIVATPLPSDVDLRFVLVPVGDRLYGVGGGAVYALR